MSNIRYPSGGRTKVEIINQNNKKYPLCKVLATSPTSIYKIGQKVHIYYRILYTYSRRVRRQEKWDNIKLLRHLHKMNKKKKSF